MCPVPYNLASFIPLRPGLKFAFVQFLMNFSIFDEFSIFNGIKIRFFSQYSHEG
jgi:hypothetical protein